MSIDSAVWYGLKEGGARRRWDRWISPSSHSQMSDQLSHSFFRICPFCTLFFDPIFLTVLMLSDNSQIPLLNQGSVCIVQELLLLAGVTFTFRPLLGRLPSLVIWPAPSCWGIEGISLSLSPFLSPKVFDNTMPSFFHNFICSWRNITIPDCLTIWSRPLAHLYNYPCHFLPWLASGDCSHL